MLITTSHRARRTRSSQIRELLKLTHQPDVLSLAGGLPAPTCMPVERIARAVDRVLSIGGPTGTVALQYGPTEGTAHLRSIIAADHGVSESQVLITTGSQQGLSLLAHVLGDPGDRCAVVDPTYLGAIQAFEHAEIDVVATPSDAHGPCIEPLAALLDDRNRPVRATYVVPDFANPTGHTISLERRSQLASLADRSGSMIIEDRPYVELRFRGEPVPAIATMSDRVVQLGTASKVVAPGLRVGWMTGPVEVIDACARAKQALDLHTSSLDQLIVADLLDDRAWLAEHLTAIRAYYANQAAALCDALDREFGERFDHRRPTGGMFIWGRFPEDTDARRVLRHALQRGVAFVPGLEFSVGESIALRSHARLSFATLPSGCFAEAVKRLAAAGSPQCSSRYAFPTNPLA